MLRRALGRVNQAAVTQIVGPKINNFRHRSRPWRRHLRCFRDWSLHNRRYDWPCVTLLSGLVVLWLRRPARIRHIVARLIVRSPILIILIILTILTILTILIILVVLVVLLRIAIALAVAFTLTVGLAFLLLAPHFGFALRIAQKPGVMLRVLLKILSRHTVIRQMPIACQLIIFIDDLLRCSANFAFWARAFENSVQNIPNRTGAGAVRF